MKQANNDTVKSISSTDSEKTEDVVINLEK